MQFSVKETHWGERCRTQLLRCSWHILQQMQFIVKETHWGRGVLPHCKDAVGIFYSRCSLVSTDLLGGEVSFPTAEMQLAYSTADAVYCQRDPLRERCLTPLQKCSWHILQQMQFSVNRLIGGGVLPHCRDAVNSFYTRCSLVSKRHFRGEVSYPTAEMLSAYSTASPCRWLGCFLIDFNHYEMSAWQTDGKFHVKNWILHHLENRI